jgi:hypothetical protein
MYCPGCSVLAAYRCTSTKLRVRKSRSANVRARKIEKREKRTRKIKERGSANAKARNLGPKKEHESASAKSFPQEHEA